jgi:protein phosphatase
MLSALTGATELMKAERIKGKAKGGTVFGGLVELQDVGRLAIIGDLHGDFNCLAAIVQEVSKERFFDDPANKMVFLGDYVDRGPNSAGVLAAVCNLKVRYAESILMMRGNHEAPSEFPFSSHDFPFELIRTFGEDEGRNIYRKSLLLFRELTLATIVAGKIMLVHGGLPTEDHSKNYRKEVADARENFMHSRVLEEILWNDPREIVGMPGWEWSDRGLGRYFGPDITRRWLTATGTACVVRGHEPCRGYKIDHGGRVMTIFSSHEPYPSFDAAYISACHEELLNLRDAADLVPLVKYPVLG